ncbi:MAG: hypothetical protein D6731_11860, partial [Planctomycetota bacterium]
LGLRSAALRARTADSGAGPWPGDPLPADLAASLACPVRLSPEVGPRDGRARLLTWPWGRSLARVVAGPEHSFRPQNERHARGCTTRYPSGVLAEMMAPVDLAAGFELERIRVPARVVASRGDRVVDSARTAAATRPSTSWRAMRSRRAAPTSW